jgi:hypothetical protein
MYNKQCIHIDKELIKQWKSKKRGLPKKAKSMRMTTMMGTKKEVMMQLNHSNSDNNANR